MIFLFGDNDDNSDDDDKVIVIVWNLSSYFMHISVPRILCRAIAVIEWDSFWGGCHHFLLWAGKETEACGGYPG